MTIKFPMIARYTLCAVLREVKGTPTDDARIIARWLLRKLKISPDEAAQFEVLLADGRVAVNMVRLNQMPELDVEIDEKEAKKLINMINTGNWGPDDDDWFDPLLEQLKQIKS